MAPNNATESGVSNMLGPTSARCVRRIARRAAAWWWKASVRCSTTQRLYAASDRLPENAAVRTSGVRRRSRGTSRGRKASRRIAANTYPTGLPTSHFGLVFCHFSLPSTKRANRSRPVRQPGVWARSRSPMPYTQNLAECGARVHWHGDGAGSGATGSSMYYYYHVLFLLLLLRAPPLLYLQPLAAPALGESRGLGSGTGITNLKAQGRGRRARPGAMGRRVLPY